MLAQAIHSTGLSPQITTIWPSWAANLMSASSIPPHPLKGHQRFPKWFKKTVYPIHLISHPCTTLFSAAFRAGTGRLPLRKQRYCMFSASTNVHSYYTQHAALRNISRAARPWHSVAANSVWQHLGDLGVPICRPTADCTPTSGYQNLSQQLAAECFSAPKQPGSPLAIPRVDRIGPLRFISWRKYLIWSATRGCNHKLSPRIS